MPPRKRKASSSPDFPAPSGKVSKDDPTADATEETTGDDGEPGSFPTVTPAPDDVTEAPPPAPSPLTPTDDGQGVILDPEAGMDFVIVPVAALDTDTIPARGADGREYVADYRPAEGVDGRPSTGSGGELRWAVSVIETKVPYAERPTRGLLDTPEQCADRRYEAVWQPLDPSATSGPGAQLGAPDAPDDDPVHGVGVSSWWRAYLTEAEVARLRAAENVESVTYEHRVGPSGSEWEAAWTGSDFDAERWAARADVWRAQAGDLA